MGVCARDGALAVPGVFLVPVRLDVQQLHDAGASNRGLAC
jgi:hypothetical protein